MKKQLSSTIGVSLVTVAVALAILSAAAYVFVQMTGTLIFGSSRIDASLKGQQVLVGVSSEVQRLDFSQIINSATVCNKKTDGSALPNKCVDSDGKLATLATAPAPAAGMPLINTPVNENGKPSDNADACVTLQSCTLLANDNMIEMKLLAYWKDPKPGRPLLSRQSTVRRGRW